jgi:hypothetical protein
LTFFSKSKFLFVFWTRTKLFSAFFFLLYAVVKVQYLNRMFSLTLSESSDPEN